MKKREKELINYLLAEEHYVTGSELAQQVGVTSRTIRNDLNRIKETLVNNGAILDSSPGKGYLLRIENYKKFDEFFNLEKLNEAIQYTDIPDNPNDRASYIIKKLLMIDYYIKIDDLADELYVSRSTITNELKEIREKLVKYDLSLNYRSGQGVKVEGEESKRRLCISEYYFHTSADDGYFAEDSILFSSTVNQEEVKTIKRTLLKILKKYDIYISDVSFQNLIIHLIISLRRMRYSYYVEYQQEEIKNFAAYEEYQAAKEIAEELGKQFNEIWSEEEICYICAHILAKRIILNEQSKVDPTGEAVFVTNSIAFELNRRTGISFSQDQHFMHVLSLHIAPLLLRLRSGMRSRNMLLEDIKNNYPFAFELAIIAAGVIGKIAHKKMIEDECGYLALYIGNAIEKHQSIFHKKKVLLVSSEGRSAMEIQKIKIVNQFGEYIERLDNVELYELPNIDHEYYDIILSSVPITYKVTSSLIYVNTILKKTDLDHIKEALIRKTDKEDLNFLNCIYSYDGNFSGISELTAFLKRIDKELKLDSIQYIFKDEDTRCLLVKDTLILFTIHENIKEFYLHVKNTKELIFDQKKFNRLVIMGHTNQQLSKFQQNLQTFESLFKEPDFLDKLDRLDNEDIRYAFNNYLQ